MYFLVPNDTRVRPFQPQALSCHPMSDMSHVTGSFKSFPMGVALLPLHHQHLPFHLQVLTLRVATQSRSPVLGEQMACYSSWTPNTSTGVLLFASSLAMSTAFTLGGGLHPKRCYRLEVLSLFGRLRWCLGCSQQPFSFFFSL